MARPAGRRGLSCLLLVRPAAVPRLATSQVNGRHRILVIPRRAAWAGATSGLVNVEVAISGNAVSRSGDWLAGRVTARRGHGLACCRVQLDVPGPAAE